MRMRFAAPGDASALLSIYAQYIETPITFESTLPTEREFAGRIAAISDFYPYIICGEREDISGYAYAHRHMEREAYQWNAELSIYLDQNRTSQGLGKRMYRILIEILRLQGIRTVYGGVTSPNAGSEALHKAPGFHALGTYHNAGYKGGGRHDVTWFEKRIAPYDVEPAPIRSIREVPEERLRDILADFG